MVLSHAAPYTRDAAPEAMARVARALGAGDAPSALYDLEVKLNLKMRLSDIGLRETDLERAAKIALESPYPNPRPVEYAGVLALLRAAYEGRRPEA